MGGVSTDSGGETDSIALSMQDLDRAPRRGLLAGPHQLRKIQLSPGERAEIVVTVRPGDRPVRRSFAPQLGAGFPASRLAGGDDTFDVLELPAAQDLSPSGPVPGRLVDCQT